MFWAREKQLSLKLTHIVDFLASSFQRPVTMILTHSDWDRDWAR